MTLINLTEDYVNSKNLSFWERYKVWRKGDLFHATSFVGLYDYFDKNRPRWNLAYIIIDGVSLKRKIDDSFKDDEEFLNKLDNELDTPTLEVMDNTKLSIEAFWAAGNSSDYLLILEEYGINNVEFAPVPFVLLGYKFHRNDPPTIGLLRIGNRQPTKEKSLKDKISELLPEFYEHVPEPA